MMGGPGLTCHLRIFARMMFFCSSVSGSRSGMVRPLRTPRKDSSTALAQGSSQLRENAVFMRGKSMAERVGFEPTLPFRVNTLSKRAPSATRPSLRRESVGARLFTEASPFRFESGAHRGSYVRFNSMGEVVETATCRERVNIRKLHVGRCDPQLQSPRICRVGFC